MSYPIRWKRLLLYFLALLLPYVFAYVLVQGTAAVIIRYRIQQGLDQYVKILPQNIQTMQNWLKNPPAGIYNSIPVEEREDELKKFNSRITQALAREEQMQKTPPTISMSYPEAILEAVFFPLAETSFGTIGPGLNIPYTAPSNLYEELENPQTYLGMRPATAFQRGWWYKLRNLLNTAGIGFCGGLAGFILFPFTFILLPASRRKAKVQWRHIFRVSVYNSFIPSTFLLISIVLFILGLVIPSLFDTASELIFC